MTSLLDDADHRTWLHDRETAALSFAQASIRPEGGFHYLGADRRPLADRPPALFLTAMGSIEDRVAGLEAGGDDYLVKPFDFAELLARLRALKRRPEQSVGPTISVKDLVIDTVQKHVTVAGKPVKLSKKEYALLEYLAHHTDGICSKDQILDHVWDFDADVLPNTVEVFIRSLRKKIDDPQSDSRIETIRGFGYRLRTRDV